MQDALSWISRTYNSNDLGGVLAMHVGIGAQDPATNWIPCLGALGQVVMMAEKADVWRVKGKGDKMGQKPQKARGNWSGK